MDDEEGGEYKGGSVAFARGLDNKLALNQKKIFFFQIPAPEREITTVNLHFGLFGDGADQNYPCYKPEAQRGYNFHQFNWDVSWLR